MWITSRGWETGVNQGQRMHDRERVYLPSKMTITSFAITLYGQFCRRHLVGQQVLSDKLLTALFVVVEAFVLCVLNLIMLLRLLIAVLGGWNASNTKHCLTHNMVACTW